MEFIAKPSAEWEARKQELWIRCGQTCELCAKALYEGTWDAHHLRHRSFGGSDDLSNLMALCRWPGESVSGGVSCHALVHRTDLIEKKFAGDPERLAKYKRVALGIPEEA